MNDAIIPKSLRIFIKLYTDCIDIMKNNNMHDTLYLSCALAIIVTFFWGKRKSGIPKRYTGKCVLRIMQG